MMSLVPISTILLTVETLLFFSFALFAFARATKITRNSSYLLLIISTLSAFVSYVFASITGFYRPEDNKTTIVLTLIILTDIFLAFAFLCFTNALILIRNNKLSIFSHLSALMIGASIILSTDLNLSNLVYDSTTSMWKVKYDSLLFLIVTVIFMVIFLSFFILYLVRKIVKNVNTRHFDISFLGFLILALWMISTHIQEMHPIRRFLFPLAMLFLGIAVFIDPLNMLASKNIPEEIILVSNHNYPLIRFKCKDGEIDRNLEEVKMLIVGRDFIAESLNSKSKAKEELKLRNKEIKHLYFKDFYIIVTGTKIDRNSQAAIYSAVKEFESKTDLEYVETSSTLKPSDEEKFKEIFSKNMKRINACRKDKNSTEAVKVETIQN